MRHRITLIAAALTLLLQGLPARAQFAVIDAQNAANQIMSYIQDGENALRSIESIAQVFESIERVHGALDSLQSIYSRVSPVIRDTKAVADIAVNYARVVDDWERYSDYMKSLVGASYNEMKYSYYWGTRLVRNAAEDFEYARKLISSRGLNMDDYQRYSQLQQLAGRLSSIHRAFSGTLERKRRTAEQTRAVRDATRGLRNIMN